MAPGGVDANLTLEQMQLRNPFSYEQEILFSGGIDTRYIRGVQIQNADGSLGPYIANPNFCP